MSWNAPSSGNDGKIIYYDIRWTERSADWDDGMQVSFFQTATHHTIWGLNGETEYEVQVRAVIRLDNPWPNHEVPGPWSPSAYVTTPVTITPPPTPTPEPLPEGEPIGKDDFEVCDPGILCNEPGYVPPGEREDEEPTPAPDPIDYTEPYPNHKPEYTPNPTPIFNEPGPAPAPDPPGKGNNKTCSNGNDCNNPESPYYQAA